MRVQITLAEVPWKHCFGKAPPHLKKFEPAFLDLLADYHPKPVANATGGYGYPTFELTAEPGDSRLNALLEELGSMAKRAKPRKAVAVWRQLNPEESKRARFLKPYYFSSFVDEDTSRRPLNPFSEMCWYCSRAMLEGGHNPDFSRLSAPFLVNKSALKNSEVFHTRVGLIVVRKRVLDLLQKTIGDQIICGEAAIAKSTEQPKGDDRLYWVQPKAVIGKKVWLIRGSKKCPKCKRSFSELAHGVGDEVNQTGPGLRYQCYRVECFGTGKADIAWADESAVSLWPKLLMSGALLEFLRANDVNGIVAYTRQLPPEWVHSEKGELALEPQIRTLGSVTKKPKQKDQALLKAARKETAKLKDVPWDCEKDGHVYFHLSTPQFIVLDPMTWEEDSEGPYTVKNFTGPGLYRLPVAAIKEAKEDGRGVAVDSATLMFVDNAFYPDFVEAYDWDKANTKSGASDWKYHQQVAEQVGTRFGVCSTPPAKFKSQFIGDGFYTVDVQRITEVTSGS
jgi:hypothetical protein